MSPTNATPLVTAFVASLTEQLASIKSSAKSSAKVPKALPSTFKELAEKMKGASLGDAVKRDWVIWHAVGNAHNAKDVPLLASGVLLERLSILVECGKSGPLTDCAVALHVLDNIDAYVKWELALPGSAPPKTDTAPDAKVSGSAPPDGTPEAALTKLDFRCGQIMTVEKVEGSTKLYLVQVDIGDEKPRQVITGLQTFYKETDLKNRRVVVYCNIKTGKLAGHESQAMILAATKNKGADNEVCELLDPPKNVAVGTRPMCGDLEVGSQSDGVNVKNVSKFWNVVQPLLLPDAKGHATFSGTDITLDGAPITTGSLRAGAEIE